MTAENPGTIVITRRFDFSIERVFDAWLDPAKASKFLFATPTGQLVRVDIDARVGGSSTSLAAMVMMSSISALILRSTARADLSSPSQCRSSRPK